MLTIPLFINELNRLRHDLDAIARRLPHNSIIKNNGLFELSIDALVLLGLAQSPASKDAITKLLRQYPDDGARCVAVKAVGAIHVLVDEDVLRMNYDVMRLPVAMQQALIPQFIDTFNKSVTSSGKPISEPEYEILWNWCDTAREEITFLLEPNFK